MINLVRKGKQINSRHRPLFRPLFPALSISTTIFLLLILQLLIIQIGNGKAKNGGNARKLIKFYFEKREKLVLKKVRKLPHNFYSRSPDTCRLLKIFTSPPNSLTLSTRRMNRLRFSMFFTRKSRSEMSSVSIACASAAFST